jgi:methyl-accepting chemotaxis protein
MTQMQEASQRVSEITSLIDSISFQTNLLALNAAVEAARAGDHGRGFAVVAGEVRALAGKSSNAARDIRALIDNTIEQVRKGTQLANQSGDSLNHIQQSIVKVSDLVTAMASQSQQQRGIIDGLNQDMGAMESTTQQNAALVEEISAATARMQDQTESLTALVNQFKLAGGQGRVQAQLGNF